VTLTQAGRLRGCIGSLRATRALREDVQRNALSAAFQDPRFAPLNASDLAQTEIEVSILGVPQPLDYTAGEDLRQRLRPHRDGVIIRQGTAGATFLPQVWEQLPRPEDFLDHLCRKAGLPAKAWLTGKLEVETYHVQYFKEEAQS
jgi:AmmeMemoRadiSam system protein A